MTAVFIKETEVWLTESLQLLGWTKDQISSEQTVRVSKKRTASGNVSSEFFYRNAANVVQLHIDGDELLQVLNSPHEPRIDSLPDSVQQFHADLPVSARLRFYQYCIERAQRPPPPKVLLSCEAANQPVEHGPKSHLEILAEIRDQKRRRQTYRGKNYTANKSNTQVLRDLIGQQMQALEEDRKQQEEQEGLSNTRHTDKKKKKRHKLD